MGLDDQRHSPAVLPPGETLYPLYRRLGGPQGRSERVRKILLSPGFDPRTVLPIVNRCTGPQTHCRTITYKHAEDAKLTLYVTT
jgi:hypothetical protein